MEEGLTRIIAIIASVVIIALAAGYAYTYASSAARKPRVNILSASCSGGVATVSLVYSPDGGVLKYKVDDGTPKTATPAPQIVIQDAALTANANHKIYVNYSVSGVTASTATTVYCTP